MDMEMLAVVISAVTSSLSAGVIMGGTAWLYQKGKKVDHNTTVLHDYPGLVEQVAQHREILIDSGEIEVSGGGN